MKKKLDAHYVALIFGLAIIAVFALFSIFPDAIAPYDPKDMFEPFIKPNAQHILGTNDMGYDIFSELVFAASATLKVGLFSAFVSIVIGTVLGMAAGYMSGILGEGINIIIQIFLLIPMLPMAIVLAAFLGAGEASIIITIALMGWSSTAKAVRAKTIKLKNMEFVQSLKILGFSGKRIVFKHILPNLSEVIFARYMMTTAAAMLTEASLSFLGLNNSANVTWGGMVNFAYKRGGFAAGAYNWFLAPGICIMLSVLALYMINIYFEKKALTVEGTALRNDNI